ncbi:heterokaryon incompatibility protein-domain-containing protein [Echria macrotheca]|uniref:Heterokaryon incompatibility protein-domain-containing protein n=1 Tax=Echria macrotheca TaxID=438768 RepID=A0AAJ0F8J3_9PEZI|nr:heterokaryon incompatibility protein-domain-containing protein [Echria macrotheca]
MNYAPYQYAPLSAGHQAGEDDDFYSIRLLHLLPSPSPASPLQCLLIETRMNPDGDESLATKKPRQVEYHALSYTWGDPIFTETLPVIDHVACGPITAIHITQNLHAALLSLRKPDTTLVLWVDAVCINQADVLERNSQVSNMPTTYSRASSVIVWLGADSPHQDGRLCLEFFDRLARLITSSLSEPSASEKNSWRIRLKINRLVSTFLDSAPEALVSFLERPWFRRRWIIQEVVLAKDVVMHCGSSSIPWKIFELVMVELFSNDKGGFTSEHRTTMRTMARMRHDQEGARRQFPLETLVEFSSFLCADPRDRLYALYGVMQQWFPGSGGTNSTGTIDYAISVEETYTKFATLMLRSNCSGRAELKYSPLTHTLQLAASFRSTDALTQGMPSWVVDWMTSPGDRPRTSSSRGSRQEVDILSEKDGVRLLLVAGILDDVVTARIDLDISPFILGLIPGSKRELNDFLSRAIESMEEIDFPGIDRNDIYRTREHIVRAIVTTLVSNWEQVPANSYFAQTNEDFTDSLTELFLDQLHLSNYHLPESLHRWPAYVELIAITMRGRSLFLTDRGFMGIAPSDVRAGDVVCLLRDSNIPFILRPIGVDVQSKDGTFSIANTFPFHDATYVDNLLDLDGDPTAYTRFQLMGDAYVHGFGDGPWPSDSPWCEEEGQPPLLILPIA